MAGIIFHLVWNIDELNQTLFFSWEWSSLHDTGGLQSLKGKQFYCDIKQRQMEGYHMPLAPAKQVTGGEKLKITSQDSSVCCQKNKSHPNTVVVLSISVNRAITAQKRWCLLKGLILDRIWRYCCFGCNLLIFFCCSFSREASGILAQ